ncbi:MAG TPA: type IV pilin [Thermoplasmatales archaeon]|nr:type IV pilin [Thermoplasmatales archaeon]
MKANRKFIEANDEAVSAVIGVILMVAITVAIAATVYVYVSGMIGTSPQSAPNIQFVKDDVNNKLTVAKAEPGNVDWSDLEISLNGTVVTSAIWSGNFSHPTSVPNTGTVSAGDYIQFKSGHYGTLTIRHVPTNTLLGTWEFH